MTIALTFLGLLLLLFTGLPIFAGLALFGAALLVATQGELGSVTEVIFGELNRYLLVAIPLFAFMAQVMIRGRIVDDLYRTAYTLTRHLPGGLGIATIAACTVFAAISGSSVATALTIGAVAIPQMIRFGYEPKAAYGLVAAGGTLGILIPPSGPMVLYGVTTDTSIGGLFMAGIVPGLLMAGVFVAWSMMHTAITHRHVEREPRATLREAAAAIRKAAWAISLPVFVLGGMYAGVFTATEAAAAGAWLALLVAMLVYRSIGLRAVWDSALDASRLSAMLFMIMAGASVFGHILTKLRVPQQIVEAIIGADIGVAGFLIVMMALIFVLGMFLESIAIILITTPVILPAMQHLGIDPIWYGVLLVINLELAQITPPVGMNLFTIKAITKAPLGPIVRGSAPYVVLMIAVMALVMAWPQIALWLPGTMMGR
ncbi:MAG TPA: TRAP transporter large permease [Rubrivivax sp.]|mgnify:CR=1 FL=1|jgi:C4-dicarboxylate transporter DctM subunit|nr:TRAP transporter large permease [Rhodoferax sp.]MCL4738825.1 TRAP transporter large permease [Burkholderiaceae bacterium]MCP5290403.1 TRAP transporter large permease [Burkholderiaceae bacterium]HMQ71589.1 TRAP transporter large permease [Rubrivivax sp.]HMR69399.1 TRAP transporter large permease [Rubrivivax sp.]